MTSTLSAGQLIAGRYRLVAPLGRGAQATVWEALDQRADGRVCALKFARRADVRAELEALARVEHPSLPKVFDVGEHEGTLFVVLERVVGQPLDKIAGAPAVTRALFAVAEALTAVHDAGLVHGDIKPSNILAAPSGERAFVVDFGMAAADERSPIIAGSLAFMAPEVLAGERGPSADLYALGVSAAWALARAHPLVEDPHDRDALLDAFARGAVVRATLRERLAQPVRDAVLALLSSEPGARGTARTFLARLARDAGPWLSAAQRERGAAAQVGRRPVAPLLGREAVLEQCRTALERALLDGQGVGVVVAGLEGSGRSRLVSEALRALKVRLAARGSLCAIVDELLVEPDRPTIVRLLDAPIERVASTLDAVARLRRFAPPMAPIAVVATCAAPIDERQRAALSTSATFVSPGPLARAEVSAMLEALLGRAVSDGALDAFIERGDALPGRIARLALALDPAVAATATDADLRRAQALGAEPSTLVAALDPLAHEAFERLMLAGRSLALEALSSDPREARRALAALCAAGLARSEGPRAWLSGPASALVSALPPRGAPWTERARALARSLDALGADEPEARARIAWVLDDRPRAHSLAAQLGLDRARATQDAVRWLALAHEAAPEDRRVALALGRAYTWLGESERAEQLLATLAPTPEVLLARIDALRNRGERDRARALRDELARSSDASSPVAAAALTARELVESGDIAAARAALDTARPLADTEPTIALRWTEVRAHLALVEADVTLCETLIADAQGALDVLDDDRVRARFRSLEGMARQARGAHGLARESFARAWTLAQSAGDTRAAATYAVNLGTAEWLVGALGEARSWLERGVRSLAAFGTAYELARALANLAMLESLIGERASAVDLATRAERAALESKDPTAALGAAIVHAECTLEGRALAESLAALAARERAEGREAAACETFARAALAAAEAGEHSLLAESVRAIGEDAGALPALAQLAFAVETGLDAGPTREALERARAAVAQDPGPEHELALLRWTSRASQLGVSVTSAASASLEARLDALARSLPEGAAAIFRDAHQRIALRHHPRTVERGVALEEGTAAASMSLRWRRLSEITRELNSEQRLRPLLERIMDAIVELTGGTRGFLLLAGPDGALRVRAARNLGRRDLAEGEGSPSRSIAERVARTGEAILTVDASSDGALSTFESVTAMQLRSVLAVPLVVHGVPCGTVYVDDRFRAGAFGASALEVAREFAEAAALAIHNARSAAKLRRALRKSERLARALAKRVESQSIELEATRRALVTEHEPRGKYDAIVGRGAAMRRTLALCDRVAATSVPVLLLGESGTGKELIARAIHQNSTRAKKPFVAVNCAAITETLLESELFGHLRGAFTGADRARQGLFEVADGGTLFLDEVGEMSPGMQAKLLRVLQDGEVRPIGGTISRKVDVRIVAATLRDLPKLVERGAFREDLFYRLAVLTVSVPSLRERREDIPVLVQHLLAKHGRAEVKVDRRAMTRLVHYDWPGNVRQLENEVLRAALLCDGTLRESDLDPKLLAREVDPDAPARGPLDLRGAVEDVERRLVERALREYRGNQTRAAKALGLSRFGLQKMLKRLGLEETARAARA